ncbi:MAG: hypothetical protein RI996_423 [Candidatus Parcubacteria bacterium]|jgi:hypothetical protein
MKYGIVIQQRVNVQEKPSFSAERGSELLLFETVKVLGPEEGEWIQIQCGHDEYQGWIGRNQICGISEKDFKRLHSGNVFVSSRTAKMRYFTPDFQVREVSLGTPLPGALRDMEPRIVSGKKRNSVELPAHKRRRVVQDFAQKFLGTLYSWGGRSIYGVDCSGFTQVVYRFVGVSLPRNASQQAFHGEEVPFENKLIGDLAFFKNQAGSITHVGIVFPGGKIIHAKGFDEVRVDTLTEKGISDKRGTQTHILACIRRVIA